MFEILAVILLVLLAAVAAVLVARLRSLASEARILRAEIAEIRQARASGAAGQSKNAPETGVPNSARARPRADPPAARPESVLAAAGKPEVGGFAEAAQKMAATPLPALGAARRAVAPAPPAQGQLPLLPDPASDTPPVPLEVLVTALQFPETEDDTEGFRALRRALRDHRSAQLIQSAQDILTLLSQDGLYMDDLAPDRARPELWRSFAQGARGGSLSALGGIRDREVLALAARRLRDDPVFRDTAHHFLRRFDRMLTDLEPRADDAQLAAFSDTRTARAFMLLGRVTGIFD